MAKRINLATDPSLRSGTTTAYDALNGAALAYSTDYSFYGTGALRVTKNAANNSGFTTTTPIPVVVGKPYAASMYVRLPQTIPASESANLVARVEWRNSLNIVVKTDTSSVLDLDNDDNWARIGGVWVAPSDATVAYVQIVQLLGGTAGATFYADALLFEQSNYIGGYFDNISQAEQNQIVNRALSAPVQQVINGLQLNADIIINDLVLNTIDEFGNIWICTGIDGWWGHSTPESPDIPRGTEDGSYDVSGRYQARLMTLTGVVYPPNSESLGAARDALVAATNLNRKGGWLRTNEEPTKAAFVRLSGRPQIQTVNARGKTEFSIGLKAADPIKYHWNDSDPEGYSHAALDIPNNTLRTNLAVNPSMETAGSAVAVITNYVKNPRADGAGTLLPATAATSISTDTFTGWTGNSHKVVCSGTSAGTVQVQLADRAAASVGQRWHVSTRIGLAPATVGSRSFTLYVAFYDAGAVLVGVGNLTFTLTPGQVTSVTATGIAPANTVSVSFQVDRNAGSGAATSDTYYLDNLMLVRSEDTTTPAFFDGATTPAGDYSYAWTGTANASTSIQTIIPVANWTPVNNNYQIIIPQSSEHARSGNYSMKALWTSSGLGAHTTAARIQFTTVVGVTYAFSAWVWVPSGMGRARIFAGSGFGTTSTVYDQWERLWVVFTATGTSTSFDVRNADVTVAGNYFYVDDALLEISSSISDYFDGNTVDSRYREYSWSGIANASTSVSAPSVIIPGTVNNIGTSEVTAVFTITGPMGAGSSIYNAATDETLTFIQPLRGAGAVGAVTKASVTAGIATLTTSSDHHLLIGDEINVVGVGSPYDSGSTGFVVTAASSVFPYTFSYDVISDDLTENTVNGQVQLRNNDVLVVDTYERSVTYNGTNIGQRSKLKTLTDWIKVAPGTNLIEFVDDVSPVTIQSKQIVSGVATLVSTDAHYLIPGESVIVELNTLAALSKKSLSGNTVTLTTVSPHGFSVSDKIDVNSVEVSTINNKVATTTVATITTVDTNGVSVSDSIVVNLPASAAPTNKALTSNVATITTQFAHGFSAGDSVTVALSALANIVNKALSSNQAILTTSGTHNFQVNDSITVSLPTTATITAKAKAGAQAVITTSAAHGFVVGDSVTVALPASATLANSRSSAGSAGGYVVTLNTTGAHGFGAGDIVSVNVGLTSTFTITNRASSGNTRTLTTSGTHGFSVGERITMSGINANYNGVSYISAVTSNTFSYLAGSSLSEGTTASGGSATNNTIASSYNGTKVIETVPNSTSFTYLAYDQDFVTSSTTAGSGATLTNTTNAAFNGTKTLISASGTQFTYNF